MASPPLLTPLTLSICLLLPVAAHGQTDRIQVIPDEAVAILAALDKRAAGQPLDAGDWSRIFSSQGFLKCQIREHARHRPFEETAFRDMVGSDSLLSRRQAFHHALEAWQICDSGRARERALGCRPDPNG